MPRLSGLAKKKPFHRLAVVLGTNEIASAVAVLLRRSGRDVILSHDPLLPVIRRGMAFHDALFGDPTRLEGIEAQRIDFIMEAFSVFENHNRVAITPLGLTDLLVLGKLDLLIDARMQKHAAKPDLRRLAKLSVGLGPGFDVHGNCDVAIETKPGQETTILRHGVTELADGLSMALGSAGNERFVRGQDNGCWRTSLDIGVRVFKGVVIGHHDGQPVIAPIDGVLRGLVRDGTEVCAGLKLIEIDPRPGRAAKWSGIDDRARRIGVSTRLAVEICENERVLAGILPFFE
jgi:hypothetical protein